MLMHARNETSRTLTVKTVQFVVYRHARMGRLMFSTHVQRGIWYADNAAHMVLLGVIALVLVAVQCMC